MRKLLPFLIAVFSYIGVNGQISTMITGARSQNTVWYGCSTFHCLTMAQEAAMHDTTLALLAKVLATIPASAGLQGVLDAGNTALNQLIELYAGGSCAEKIDVQNNGVFLYDHSGADPTIWINSGACSGQPSISFYDRVSGGGNYARLKSNLLSGIRDITLPDEDGSIVVHTTTTSINVGNTISGNYAALNPTNVSVNVGGSNMASLSGSILGGGGTLQLKDISSVYTARVRTASFTMSHYFWLHDSPNSDDTIATKADLSALTPTLQQVLTNGNRANNVPVQISHYAGGGASSDSLTLTTTGITVDGWSNSGSGVDNNLTVNKSNLVWNYFNTAFSTTSTGILNFPNPTLSGANSYSWELPKHTGTLVTNDGAPESQNLIGASSITVMHGLTYTPSNVIPVPTDALTGTSFRGYYLSTTTSTTFTFTFAAPVTGVMNFRWQAFP